MAIVCVKLRPQYLATSLAWQSRSQGPRGLRRGSAAAHLLGLRIRIRLGAWMPVSNECCVLSGRGLCVGLITRPEESYRACVFVCLSLILKPRQWGGPDPLGGPSSHKKCLIETMKKNFNEDSQAIRSCCLLNINLLLPEFTRWTSNDSHISTYSWNGRRPVQMWTQLWRKRK